MLDSLCYPDEVIQMLDCKYGLDDPSTVRIQNRDWRGFFDTYGLL
jgi:hypothetical protein